jgi:hypothetical protein
MAMTKTSTSCTKMNVTAEGKRSDDERLPNGKEYKEAIDFIGNFAGALVIREGGPFVYVPLRMNTVLIALSGQKQFPSIRV